MKIKQFLGRDMRDALRQVRAQLGPDAVLLGTRSTGAGVEVSAAIDVDRLRIDAAELFSTALPPISAPPPVPVVPVVPVTAAAPVTAPVALPPDQQAMTEELRTLRQLLERQLSALAWNDYTRREPLRARALTELTELGLGRDVALGVVGELPAELSVEQAQRLPYGLLVRRIATGASPISDGGTVALIGSAGSGRTTVLAKLARDWLRDHAPDSLVIVTLDGEHFGAAEQSRSLGRLLGAPTYRFADSDAFANGARCMEGAGLVLIDTPALSGDDEHARALADDLAQVCPSLHSVLMLPASTQAGALDEMVRRAQPFLPQCSVVTRLDEAVSLGGLLSTLVRTRLPVALISDGPRILDALRTARPLELVAHATELAGLASAHADEDLLARRFGGDLHAAA